MLSTQSINLGQSLHHVALQQGSTKLPQFPKLFEIDSPACTAHIIHVSDP
jgi:hypothetical protein